MPAKPSQNPSQAAGLKPERSDFYLPPYLNPTVLKTAFVATLGAAIIAVPPGLSDSIAAEWPWPRPGFMLLALSIFALASIVALIRQQRFVVSSHLRYERSKAELLRHTEKSMSQLYAVLDISHMVGEVRSLQEVFDSVTRICGDVFNCDMSSLMMYDKGTEELVVKSIGGKRARKEALGDRKRIGEGISGWAAEHREPLLLSAGFNRKKYPGLNVQRDITAMVVPILLGDELVGVLNVSQRFSDYDYDEEDVKSLQVYAENVGTRIRYAQEKRAFMRHIESLESELAKLEAQVSSSGPNPGF